MKEIMLDAEVSLALICIFNEINETFKKLDTSEN